jgi:anti-sigma B factor antagonist
MPVYTDRTGDVVVYTATFEHLDAGNTDEFKASVQSLLIDRAKLVFDLGRITFVDSSGLGALLSCLREVKSRGGDLKLCGMTRQVRELFDLVRMHRVFEIFGSVEEAKLAYINPIPS